MRKYSVTEFRDHMAAVLERAENEVVVIQRNGREYEITLRRSSKRSGLDVPGVEPDQPATRDSILEDIRAGRQRR